MPTMAIDPGIVGVSYQAPMTLQDAENAINYYVEVAEVDGAKEPVALLGTPGKLVLNGINGSGGQIRGYWVLPGGQQALAVAGNVVWLTYITTPATQTSIPQFNAYVASTAYSAGNPPILQPNFYLLTNSGPVIFRDNGVVSNAKGGYVFIVDGTYMYYVNIYGVTNQTLVTLTFTAGITAGSTTLTLPGTLPAGLIISPSAQLSDAGGNIPSGTYISSINYNTPSITMSQPAGATITSDTITLTVLPFGLITDPGAVASTHLAFIEGWIIANQVGTRNFIVNGPSPYTNVFVPTYFALKDSSTDNLVCLIENNRELWLIGERTTEVWYNNGGSNANFPFSRVPGVGPQIGCSAKYSLSRMGPSLVWLAKNEQGENVIIQTNQYSWERISNHAIEHAISQYPLVSDAIGFVYEEEGHTFYVLTFPTADATWVYDATASALMNKTCWHQRASFDPVAGVFHRDRANCFMNFGNLRIVGDYGVNSSGVGMSYVMSRKYYVDGATPLKAQRRCKHIWKKVDRTRVSQTSLQIEFTPGVGLQTGQGQTPECMLRWSSDGGFTWSNEHWLPIGAAGATRNRAKINRLGQARDRVYEISFSDPVPRDIIGATLFGEAEDT